jgi:transposase-like protein
MTADLTNPIFSNEEAARKHFEAIRWPDGVVCPHCGVAGEATELKGKSTRPGLYKCRACQKPFTATMGTLYERSHIPLHKWLLATHLMAASKKGISAHQLWRMLGFGSYRTAWFMAHRIREGMAPLKAGPLGGEGKTVEAGLGANDILQSARAVHHARSRIFAFADCVMQFHVGDTSTLLRTLGELKAENQNPPNPNTQTPQEP